MESAEERKARLKALRQEAAAAEVSEPAARPAAAAVQPAAPEPPTLKFRNYAPRDEKIEHDKIAPANPEQFAPPPADEEEDDDEPGAKNGEARPVADLHLCKTCITAGLLLTRCGCLRGSAGRGRVPPLLAPSVCLSVVATLSIYTSSQCRRR